MSDDYAKQIDQIKRATSLDEIQALARQYSAKASGDGGILYSRDIGNVSSETIALELAGKTGEPIINSTPRAQFLGNKQVEAAARSTAERVFVSQGQSLADAEKAAGHFLYGDAKAAARSATSLEGCLWGEASQEFAASLRGDIKLIATNANVERVFGKVELPTVLDNPNVRTLGGQPVAALKPIYARQGATDVLPMVQAQFIEAAPKGIFVAPDGAGPKVTKVAISREAAATLGADAAKFPAAAELSAAGLARAPLGLGAAPAASVGEAAVAAEAVGASRGLSPGVLSKGATAVAVAAVAYDFATTGHQVVKLEAQGNTIGAESAKTHFIGRNVGGIGGGIALGFVAGAGYGLAGGAATGPGALVTSGVGGVVGGVGGAFLGEKWAQQKDLERVFTQQDRDGNTWSRDPKDPKGTWTRVAEAQHITAETHIGAGRTTPTYGKVRYVAGDMLANELNYKSANASYELGLANLSAAQNPYSIAPGNGDTRSADGEGNWVRDAHTHAWSRTVVDQYLEHGMTASHVETASPQRAAELDHAAKLIIAQNATNTPAAIAGRYQIAYNQFGWNRHGEVPVAAQNASTQTESLAASDGHTYTRNANGEWMTPGMIYGTNQASGNVRDELNEVYRSQQAGLQQYAVLANEALAHPTLPQPTPMRSLVAHAYANAGIARTEADIDAATAAVARTHAQAGLDRDGRPYSLTLQPDQSTGRPGPNSAIVTMMDDGQKGLFSNSRMVPKAVTTAEEIKHAAQPTQSERSTPVGPARTPDAAPHTERPAAVTPNATTANGAGHATHGDQQPGPHDGLSSNDQTMFYKLRAATPREISDEHVAHAMLLSKKEGITDATKIDGVRMSGDTLWVVGTTPGFKVSLDTREPAPPLHETSQHAQAFDRQQAQQLAYDASQQERVARGGQVV